MSRRSKRPVFTYSIAVYTGLKPNKHIWGLVQFYLTGWASKDELIEQLTKYRDEQARKEAAKNQP